MIVVLSAIAELEETNITDCVKVAYNDIKDRKGKLLANGNFVKEEDLPKVREATIISITYSLLPEFNPILNVKLDNGNIILVMVELNENKQLSNNFGKIFIDKNFSSLISYLDTLGKVTTL